MNNLKLTFIALGLYSTAYLVLFLTWALILFNAKSVSDPAQFIAYIHDALIALTAHVLTILNASPPAPPTGTVTAAPASTQGGFAVPAMMIALALGSMLLISGCSGLSVQWVASYSTTDLATAIKMPMALPGVAPTPGVIAGSPAIGAAVANLLAPVQPAPVQPVAVPAK